MNNMNDYYQPYRRGSQSMNPSMNQSVNPSMNPSMNGSMSGSCSCSNSADKLMDMIDRYSFAMDDTRLFLDTHPDCMEALAFFRKMQKLREDAIHEYEDHYGPVTAYRCSDASDSWMWNAGDLPWQIKRCSCKEV